MGGYVTGSARSFPIEISPRRSSMNRRHGAVENDKQQPAIIYFRLSFHQTDTIVTPPNKSFFFLSPPPKKKPKFKQKVKYPMLIKLLQAGGCFPIIAAISFILPPFLFRCF